VADRNRGGRSRDDDPIENDDELEAEFDDEIDEEVFEDEDEADEAPATRRRRAGGGAAARTVPRVRTREARPGFLGRILNFIREIFAELQKVIWPTRKELLTYTTVVIVFVAIMMTFVALLDVGFARLMFLVFGNTQTPAAS
jgi:preprotein translocase subunit SecE